jgi:hypothetical protein
MAKLKGTRVLEVTSMGGNGPAAAQSMTMQKPNFSHEAIPSSIFEVPSGYKKVDSLYDCMSK